MSMIVPEYWAEAREHARHKGRSVTVRRFGWSDERRLAQALVFGAGEPARWSADGRRRWPTVGDPAGFLLVAASCTAEAVARRARRVRVFRAGRQTFAAQ